MSEYRVDYTQVPSARSDDEKYGGLLIHIRPPVQICQEAVARYLTHGSFVPVDQSWENAEVKDVVLLGSTPEQTTIYASVDKRYEYESLAEQAANDTVRLLQFMGATAIIDQPSAPDA